VMTLKERELTQTQLKIKPLSRPQSFIPKGLNRRPLCRRLCNKRSRIWKRCIGCTTRRPGRKTG
jgi:hypothetical protein